MKLSLKLNGNNITQKLGKQTIPYYDIYYNKAKTFYDKYKVSQSGYSTSKGYLIFTFNDNDIGEVERSKK